MLCCILLASVAGRAQAQSQPVVLDSLNVTDYANPSDWDTYIASWDYVIFENPSNVEAVDDCFFNGNSIVAQAHVNGQQTLLHYKLDGTYIGEVGKFGLSEKEYAYTSSILLDEAKDRLSVCDMLAKQKCVTYRLSDGSFISTEAIPNRLMSYTRNVYPLQEANTYLGYTTCGRHRLCYFITDSTFSRVDTLSLHPAQFPLGSVNFATHPVTCHQGNYSMLAPLNDTIYTLRHNALYPRLVFRTHNSVPLGYQPTKDDYLTQTATLEKQGYIRKDGLYETDKWLVITDKKGLLFYNKDTRKGSYLPEDMPQRGDLIYPQDLWSEHNGRLIAVYTPEELLALKHEMEAANVVLSKKIQTLFARLHPGTPLILIFYTLR